MQWLGGLNRTAAAIEDAAMIAAQAVDADDERWARLAVGQDTEEAESSGYIVGYRDAIANVREALKTGDPELLTTYTDGLRDDMEAWRKEAEEEA